MYLFHLNSVSQSSSVRKNTDNIRQRSSDTEMPSKALTTELNTHKVLYFGMFSFLIKTNCMHK